MLAAEIEAAFALGPGKNLLTNVFFLLQAALLCLLLRVAQARG